MMNLPLANRMDEGRVADYFVVAGLPPDPVPLEEFSNESVLKPTHRQDPIVELAVINRSLSEVPPPNFRCIEFTPTGHPADLNHGSIRAPEMYICFRRGRDKPPLVDLGVLYEGKERVMPGCEVLYLTPHGRSANINNSNNTRIYITFRRADTKAASDTLAVMDIAVTLANKGEDPPHAFCRIHKNLNRGMMGSDVFLCYKKSMAKTNFLAYKPAVLGRYPLDNLQGFDLPDRVAMFCLPLGAVIESWPADARHPAPVFSTFVLTAAASDGERVYGAAVMFYELMDVSQLDEAQRQQLMVTTATTSNGVDSTQRVFAQNKSICLLSRSPFFSAFKQFLVYIYRMSLAESPPHPAPIERYIAHFLTEVPCPSPQRPRILIQLSTTAITLSQPDETPLPKSGASFIEMLKNLGPSYCVSLLMYTLMEQKLLVHSVRPATLTSVAEAISNMIFPFHWQCPYIPMCPISLSYVLNSPTPFIVGVDSRYFDLYDPPHDVICVDLDTNSLSVPSDERKGLSIKSLHLPKKAAKVLKATLEHLCELLHQDSSLSNSTTASSELWLDSTPVDQDSKVHKKELQIETSIREAFLRFMAVVLKGYNNYLLPITKAPTLVTTDISNLFDIQGFLLPRLYETPLIPRHLSRVYRGEFLSRNYSYPSEDRFLKSRDKANHKFFSQLMKTQAFSRFIEERSFVSDKDSSLAFFDECLDKVDETRDEPRLIELDDALQCERTAFVMPPEPTGLPAGTQYSYNGFPELDVELFPQLEVPPSASVLRSSAMLSSIGSQFCPYSPMTRRTKQEVKATQKLAMKHVNYPALWAKCLLWHCYSLWFIHLPTYMKTVHSKTKALRAAFDVLVQMQAAKLQPPDEVCYRVLMQLCGLYHQPILAVKVLFEMKRQGIEPNAITYGFYNKAVLESKWPAGSSATGYQLWMKLRNVVQAVAQFRTAIADQRGRRPSVYSNSETESYTDDGQSMDSLQEASTLESSSSALSTAGATILIDRIRTGVGVAASRLMATAVHDTKMASLLDAATTVERTGTGGSSDHGYNSISLEESTHISVVIGSSESLDNNTAAVTSSVEPDVTIDVDIPPPADDVATAAVQPEDDKQGMPVSDSVNDTETPYNSVDNVDNDDTVVENNGSSFVDSTANIDNVVSVTETVDSIDCCQPSVDDKNSAVELTTSTNGSVVDTVVDNVVDNDTVVDSVAASELTPVDNNAPISDTVSTSESDISSVVNDSLQRRLGVVSPTGSPMHVVRTVVTSDDPLGLFSEPITTTTAATLTDESNAMTTSDMSLRRTSVADSVGLSSCFAGATDVTLRKSSSLSRLPGAELQTVSVGQSVSSTDTTSDVAPAVQRVQNARPMSASASPRSSLLGGSIRTAASRFASKYREIRQSMAPLPPAVGVAPTKPAPSSVTSSSAGSLTSVSSVSEQPSAVSTTVAGDVIDGQEAAVSAGVSIASAASMTTPSKSRLRVPALYSPLVTKFVGGLKSLQTNEALMNFASGLGSMTQSVRDTLIDTWSAVDEEYEPNTPVEDTTSENWSEDDGKSGCGNGNEHGNGIGGLGDTVDGLAQRLPSWQPSDATGAASTVTFDQQVLITTDDTGERGSLVGDQSGATGNAFRGSVQSIPQSVSCSYDATAATNIICPIEVEMCSLTRCPTCENLLYDEEIMAGWTADDSNLNTICQFCGSNLVPFLQIYITDYRHSVRPTLTNLSQSMDSMLSVQSALGIQTSAANAGRRVGCESALTSAAILEDTTAPSTDSGVVESTAGEIPDVETPGVTTGLTKLCDVPELTMVMSSGDAESSLVNETSAVSTTVQINVVNETAVSRHHTAISDRQRPPFSDLSRRWGSTDLCHSAGAGSDLRSRLAESRGASGVLESRRWTSECSLCAVGLAVHENGNAGKRQVGSIGGGAVDSKVDDVSSVTSSVASDSRNGTCKRCVQLEPISVPYLSPLVLRKEMENVLDQEGDLCLSSAEFIDQHPIIYWNLVWYFRRLNVPSHMPGFVLTAKCVNKNLPPSNVWTSNDSRYVGLHSNWDNIHMHTDHGPPMYVLWNKGNQSSPDAPVVSKSVMHSIVSSIKSNDVVSPLRLLLNERVKQRDCGRNRFHSIYRDILFLSFAALGRDCIDNDAYDREFRTMFDELPSRDKARMRVADRAPNQLTVSCRRLFANLEF